jgi:hypothetical protein
VRERRRRLIGRGLVRARRDPHLALERGRTRRIDLAQRGMDRRELAGFAARQPVFEHVVQRHLPPRIEQVRLLEELHAALDVAAVPARFTERERDQHRIGKLRGDALEVGDRLVLLAQREQLDAAHHRALLGLELREVATRGVVVDAVPPPVNEELQRQRIGVVGTGLEIPLEDEARLLVLAVLRDRERVVESAVLVAAAEHQERAGPGGDHRERCDHPPPSRPHGSLLERAQRIAG